MQGAIFVCLYHFYDVFVCLIKGITYSYAYSIIIYCSLFMGYRIDDSTVKLYHTQVRWH